MSESSERHARETKAKAGATVGISRETLRQAVYVTNRFSDAKAILESGEMSVNQLYCLAKGDNRVGLYVKISPGLRSALKSKSNELGVTMSDYVEWVLTQIFGDEDIDLS